ncbi:MAG: sulfite exporter TauE/SafE family protein [DPANN group archaeon]|nr:sulfite exporter TauE/SafE family protein [DPANN group archaeon]
MTKKIQQKRDQKKRDWNLFINSMFFVLGFSVIFSILGVLLQSTLSSASYEIQLWLGRIGGTVIILFGIYLLGLIRIPLLEQEHKFQIKRKFKYSYLTSFVFGAAFAVGWTPCVGPILGAILGLAVTQPGTAFLLMLSYSLGLGIPFLVVGLFGDEAKRFVQTPPRWLGYLNTVFAILLILLGILVFTNMLNLIASFPLASKILLDLQVATAVTSSTLNIGIAFFAGLVSFLSPCVLPLIPAFLAYLASTGAKKR